MARGRYFAPIYWQPNTSVVGRPGKRVNRQRRQAMTELELHPWVRCPQYQNRNVDWKDPKKTHGIGTRTWFGHFSGFILLPLIIFRTSLNFWRRVLPSSVVLNLGCMPVGSSKHSIKPLSLSILKYLAKLPTFKLALCKILVLVDASSASNRISAIISDSERLSILQQAKILVRIDKYFW